ncbi:hypothetical protein B0H63DRAFT_466202 [Podospora didyma]|uniref:NADH:flavin oxidoreductase/NADH oxidase N-terminal domain-containing protein n=1 Tax=Podospora didyma TaxID=330526 RepID=A0AAE0NZJ9_9PEZI|nr:hypothetical protein B0H63DRAFT_466202 [Podospora didyma]
MSSTRLASPLAVGKMQLKQRIAMAPLTRFRATVEHVPNDLMLEYYSQRASVPGTLLITEATFMSPKAGGYNNVPGIYNADQVKAWRKITDAVHARGSYIYCQLWHLGRAAKKSVADSEGFKVVSSSAVPLSEEGSAVPEALTVDEIRQTVQDYVTAAKNAIEAGFDGVEVHGANGYLIDQFIQDTCNKRTDDYGGSIENRSRFAVEVVTAVSQAVGPERTGLRLSPFSVFQDMRMADPIPQFSDIIRKISPLNLAYLHVVAPDIAGNANVSCPSTDSLDFVVDLWSQPLLVAGNMTEEAAKKLVEVEYPSKDVIAVFGRYFIANPDLPFRVLNSIPLNPFNPATFYSQSPVGYVDQPFSKEFEAKYGVQAQQLRN